MADYRDQYSGLVMRFRSGAIRYITYGELEQAYRDRLIGWDALTKKQRDLCHVLDDIHYRPIAPGEGLKRKRGRR